MFFTLTSLRIVSRLIIITKHDLKHLHILPQPRRPPLDLQDESDLGQGQRPQGEPGHPAAPRHRLLLMQLEPVGGGQLLLAVVEVDFEIAEVGLVVSQDLVISVDPDAHTVVQAEVVKLDREDEEDAVIDGPVELIRMSRYT